MFGGGAGGQRFGGGTGGSVLPEVRGFDFWWWLLAGVCCGMVVSAVLLCGVDFGELMVNLLWWFCGGARGSGGGSVSAEHL
jgi:hypothetical protein